MSDTTTHPLVTFTPSAMAPDVLEAIFVKREPLARKIVASIKASASSKSKQHWLLVGPRGIGKTHLVSLVYHRLTGMKTLRKKLVVAWLREEAWEVASYLNLLEAILQAVAEDQGGETATLIEAALDSFLDLPPSSAERAAEDLLRQIVGTRTLLLIAENLDEVFQGLGLAGQRSLRALVENTDQVVLLATTPSLFAGVSSHAQPFYGLFTVEHLHELGVDEARDLLQRVARLRGDTELVAFLDTDTGSARLRVISELAGGHPRIWVLFANCVSVTLLDELVPLFIKMLDDLTPYYQERMRALPPQQRRIVTYLADVAGARPVREIARGCRLDQRSTAKLLGDLESKGFVRRAEIEGIPTRGDKRLSAYELREPLMRLCLDVKESRGKPLRLIVAFLRHWYGGEVFSLLSGAAPGLLAERYLMEAARDYIAVQLGHSVEVNEVHVRSTMKTRELFAMATLLFLAAAFTADASKIRPWEVDLESWLLQRPDELGRIVDTDALEGHFRSVISAADSSLAARELAAAVGHSGYWILWVDARTSTRVSRHLASLSKADITQFGELLDAVVEDAQRLAARRWVEMWRKLLNGDEYDVSLRILDAVVHWSIDRDRQHLLALPVEERRVVEDMIRRVSEPESKG